jgi:hypothetical protein
VRERQEGGFRLFADKIFFNKIRFFVKYFTPFDEMQWQFGGQFDDQHAPVFGSLILF